MIRPIRMPMLMMVARRITLLLILEYQQCLRYWQHVTLHNHKERVIEMMLIKYVILKITEVAKLVVVDMMLTTKKSDNNNISDNDNKNKDDISRR